MMRILVLTVLIALGLVVQQAMADEFAAGLHSQTISQQVQGPAPNHLLRNTS